MPGIDLEDNASLQQTEWRTQRVGWFVWFAIIVAACLGLLGPGPLSAARNTDAEGGVTVAYDRFLHYHHPTEFRIMLGNSLPANRELELTLSQDLLNRIQIRRIEPEPLHSSLASDGIVYAFNRSDSADSGEIVFHVDFKRMGQSHGSIKINGREPIVLNQFVYP
jgi:hypothetical protein